MNMASRRHAPPAGLKLEFLRAFSDSGDITHIVSWKSCYELLMGRLCPGKAHIATLVAEDARKIISPHGDQWHFQF